MTDPAVEFPHADLVRDEYAPRLYRRDGTPAGQDTDFDELWRDHGVALSTIDNGDGSRSTVSTLFLGLDHRLPGDDAPPILFETAVFDGTGLVFRARARSEQAARESHVSALIDLVAAIGRSTRDDPFPTGTVAEVPDDSDSLPEP